MPGFQMTEKKLNQLYKLLDVPMIDFDCGKLCAPQNDGIPACCDPEVTIPVLFLDEYHWQRKNGPFWKKVSSNSPDIKELESEIDPDKDVLATCPGCSKCERHKRALVCRTFPFEPHTDDEGFILGMTYNFGSDEDCPLIGKTEYIYNRTYIRNSMRFWEKIFVLFPIEKELYIEESQKLRKAFEKQGRDIPLFC